MTTEIRRSVSASTGATSGCHSHDPDEWDRYYPGVHLPLAAKVPGLTAQRAGRVLSATDGSAVPYPRGGRTRLRRSARVQSALESPEGQEAAQDYARIAPPGSLLLVAEVLLP
ncbi:MAG: EthD family reductase [Solirubrobacteraceae bacterium]